MEFGGGLKLPLWALLLTICCIQQKASSTESIYGKINFIPPMRTLPIQTTFNEAHNGRVCSTWGNFHFKTFDGDIFHFPGLCNYVFASHCHTAFEDFNVQIRRVVKETVTTFSHIALRLEGVDIEMEEGGVLVNGERVQMPYSGSGFNIEKLTMHIKVEIKLGLTLMWDEKDSLMMELDEKYANQTCGLCGDFNGIPNYNEFFSNNVPITPLQFGNMQKLNGPTEDCEDPLPLPLNNCTDVQDICREILTGPAFAECNAIVWVDDYIEACVQDLCLCANPGSFSCLCDTFAEYSRQCAHAGGQPQNWRTPELCPMQCPFNMQFQECGSPCADTCTNAESSQLCEEHCIDGCFCPPGSIYDDIGGSGCIPLELCPCIYNGKTYAPGSTYSERCRSCTCTGGEWQCVDLLCPGICSVEGGSHISTYDEKHYDVHGDCTYVLSKVCHEDVYTVLGELRRCGLTETETCLKMVALDINGGHTNVVIKSNGDVFLNWIYTQLPISAGLCGNFNSRQMDDFRAISGVVEGTAPAFANTWKTQASCPNIKHHFEDPCTLSIENEKYAHHWCGLLTDSKGPFAKCHSAVNPAPYHTNCLFDTCNCERSEDCMCAALSSYVIACAAKGVELPGWRTTVCTKYTSCPKTLTYSYSITSCQRTCRSLSEPDMTCHIKFAPVDGCTCENDTYMDDSGKCVPVEKCPCYYKGTPIHSGEVLHDLGAVCTCTQGKLDCIGGGESKPTCAAPMVYFDCKNATAGSTGAECQKSCQTFDMHCYSTQCVSGCICPSGLVSDGKGNCIPMEECPCIHNDATYKPGEKIQIDCNTCVCKNRMWKCTKNKCLGTCAVYGDGHYITFDDKRYTFSGKCEYTLVQDHCGKNSSGQGSFRVITENIPCGTTGTTCSKSIKVFMGNYELILSEEHHELIQRGKGGSPPYRIRQMGIYLVIETYSGLIILWDKKTSIFIKLSADFRGQVCGLCGNYDGNGINDFTTRSQSIVGDVLEFGNSWKVSPTCSDAKCTKDPCSKNPYRKSWSQKQCSIINSKVFASCHSQVDPTKYYEACVADSCACDTGGDCECFCTAVAAYAQACSEYGVCVSWRSPSICPLFCDYYNGNGECDWHYKPCGAPCMKTCRNPSGRCLYELPGLEGCYPYCPANKPYFSEDEMRCVDVCGCYDSEDNYHPPGATFESRETCQSCQCTSKGMECHYNPEACYCHYEGKTYNYKDVIYNTTDGLGWCIMATCDINGTISREVYKCAGPSTTTPFTFTTTISATTTSGAESTTPSTTTCVKRMCEWTEWYDVSYPKPGPNNGDYETPERIRARGYSFCKIPDDADCRAQSFPSENPESLGQKIICTKTNGLICNNEDQDPPICYNYEIRFLCCEFIPCGVPTPLPLTTNTPEATPTTGETPVVPISTTSTLAPPVSTVSTTTCQPRCVWTEWFDTYYPSSSKEDGDFETLEDIRSEGGKVCKTPQEIQCRAEDYPEVRLALLGQKVQCNLHDGLRCYNADQRGKYNICYNYEVRYKCCDYSHCQPGTATPGTTTLASTPVPGTTPGVGTSRGTSLGTTPAQPVPGTTLGTTPAPPVPGTTTRTTVVPTTPEVPGSASTPSVTQGQASTGTAVSVKPTAFPEPTAELPTTSTTPVVPISTTSTLAPPVSTVSTTTCQPRCVWTEWFDTYYPSSSKDDGDFETLEDIRSEGGKVCKTPQEIQCRAEDYPEVRLALLGQKVQCNLHDGLRCYNADQRGKYNICYNYEVRYKCCDYSHCQPGTATPGTTTLASTPVPGTTPGVGTSRGTSLGTTPAPPVPGTTLGSTPAPPVPGTTTRTTVVPTTPEVPGSASTPSVAQGQASTGTAVSVKPTAFPEPTAELPTTSTTPVVPISTTSTLAPSVSTVSTTTCQPRCVWTEWFDTYYPSSSKDDGDFETLEDIRSEGGKVCNTPHEIQCRAEDYPEISLAQLGQIVQCNLHDGLQCYNADQKGKYKICYNYEVRYKCCDYSHCQPGTTTPGTTTLASTLVPGTTPGVGTSPGTSLGTTSAPPVPGTTTRTTVVPTTPEVPGSASTPSVTQGQASTETAVSVKPTAFPEPTAELPTTSTTPVVPISTTSTLAPSVSTVSTTTCQPRCVWTEWFDTYYPSSSKEDGDFETLEDIRSEGGKVCNTPHEIQCRAEDYPEISLALLGQKVQCNLHDGLRCYNADQRGKYKICYNYEVRYKCCDYSHCQPGTATPGTTTLASTPVPGTTPGVGTSRGTSLGTTPAPPVPGTTLGSTPAPPVPGTTTRTTVVPTTPEVPGSASTPSVTQGQASTGTAVSVKPTAFPEPTAELPTTSTTPVVPISTTSTLAPSVSTVSTTTCQPRCVWTEWFDTYYPSSSKDDGDFETLEDIRSEGGKVCNTPHEIQCRAEDYPEISLALLGQKVQCNLHDGLRCYNADQRGKYKICYNYEVRYKCCDYSHCQPGTATPGTTTLASTPVPGTTPGVGTSRGTSLGTTPAPPVPGTTLGSTPAPPVPGTTTRTTVVPTTPEVPGSASTPSVTQGQASTGTAVSVKPTAFPEPTAELPTTSTTPVVPISTTSTLAPSVSTVSTTTCQPRCVWTEWFDTYYPSSSKDDGDFETLEDIRSEGGKVCNTPHEIQCRAEDYPEVRLALLGQKVQCNLHDGLRCYNADQRGKYKICYNYEVRYKCCDYSHCQPGTATPGTTTLASTPVPGTTPGVGTSRGTSLGTTPAPPVPGTTLGSTPAPPVPGTTTRTTVVPTTPEVPGSASTPSVTQGQASTGTAVSVKPTAFPEPTAELPTTSTTPVVPISTTSTLAPSVSTVSTTTCQPRCVWTEWFDTYYPSSSKDDGDFETLEDIRSEGGKVCNTPHEIQCRAEDYPEISLALLGQKVQCNLHDGLRCYNADQRGKYKICYNYEVRYKCCDYSHCQPGTATPGTTTLASTPVPGTTPGVGTSRGTSLGTTPAPPVPGTTLGSTPAPPVPGTTTRTTVVPTTPEVPGSASTPSVTQGQASTGTAVSVKPTAFPEPTAELPTTSTTPVVPISTTSTLAPSVSTVSTTTCQPRCVWTEWFDTYYPSSSKDDGDFETLEDIRSEGGKVCNTPHEIQCRAEDYPEVRLALLGQKVQCNLHDGLRCYNADQRGKYKICYNYEVRYKCCDYSHCQPGTTTPGTTTAASTPVTGTTPGVGTSPGTSLGTTPAPPVPGTTTRTTVVLTTPEVPGSASTPSVTQGQASTGTAVSVKPTAFPEPTAELPTTSTTPVVPISTTSTLAPPVSTVSTTTCQPRCVWTEWFDTYYPSSSKDDGDFETLEDIRSEGGKVCNTPHEIQCRAEDYPEVSLALLGQKVLCNLHDGLWCFNADQKGKYKICYNYEVRYKCCDYSHCQPGTTTPGTTALASTPVPGTTPGVGTSPGTSLGTTPTPPVPGTTLGSTPAPPVPGTTTRTTVVPTTPEVPGSASTPSVTQGQSSTGTATTSTLAPPVFTVSPTTCQPKCHWTDWFDTYYPSSSSDDGDFETLEDIRSEGGKVCLHPQDIECRAEDHPDVSLALLQQKLHCDRHYGLRCLNSEQTGLFDTCLNYQVRFYCCDSTDCQSGTTTPGTTTVASTPVPASTTVLGTSPGTSLGSTPAPPVPGTTLGSTPAPPVPGFTTHTTVIPTTPEVPSTLAPPVSTVSSTTCQPKCHWTDWIDTHYPSSSSDDGDFETLEDISSEEDKVCKNPQEIQCRAEDYPEVSLALLGQKVQCNLHDGLRCYNADQRGKYKICYNYEVRYKCCDYSHCQPGTTTPGTSVASTPVPGTTPGVGTSPGTSLGSTPAPTVLGTTTRTTLSTTTETPVATTTTCQPKCHWTDWIDTYYPSSRSDDGDFETLEDISSEEDKVCKNPQEIQCRAEDYPEVSLALLGQKVQCNLPDGLRCYNADQKGKYKICYNYEVRYKCCDYSHCQPGTTTPGTTTAASTPVPGTTPGVGTSPGTSLGTTPAPPVPGTTLGTTPAPPVPVTTTHTTVVSSTPEVPSSSSTPSVTQGQTPTVTAVSVKSTPVSKPTEEIPTRATTETTTTLPGTSPGVGTSQGSTPSPPVPATTERTTVVSAKPAPSTAATTPVAGTTLVVGTSPGTSQGTTPAPPLPVTTKHTTVVSSTPEVPSPSSTPSVTQGQTSSVTAVSVKSTPVSKPTEEIPTRATTETTTTLPGTTPGVGTSQGSTPAPPVPATTKHTTVVSTTRAPSTAATTPVAGTTPVVGTSPGTSQGSTPARPLPVTTAHTTVVSSTPEVPSSSSTPSVTQGQTSTVTAVSVKSTPVSKPTEEIPTRATTETTTTLPGTTPGVGTSQGSTSVPPIPATTKHTTVVSTTRAPSTAATTPVAGTTPVVGTSPGTSQGSTPSPPLPVTTAHTTVVSSTPEVPSPGSTPSVTQGQTSPVTAVSVKSTPVSKPTEEIPTRATTETTTTLPGTTPSVGTSQGSTPVPPVPTTSERTTLVSTTPAPLTSTTTPVAGTTLAVGTSPGTSQGTTPAPPLPVTTAHTTVVSSTPEVPSPSSTPSVTQGQTSTVTAVSVKSTPVSKPTEEIPTRATTETTTTLPGTTPGVGTSQGSTPAPPVPATTKHTTVVSTTRAPSTAATTPVAGTTPVVGTSPGTSQGSTPAPPLPVTTKHTTMVSSTPEVPSPGSTPSVTQGQTSPVTAVSVKSTPVSKPTEEIPTRATTETTTTLPGTTPSVGTSQGSTPVPPVPTTSERTTLVSTTPAPLSSTTTPVAGTTLAVGTSPGTSQGTTPAPPLPVTTAHTTVVSSTPEVPSPSRTPSVTQGQTSTVTAVSVKSTPVSKPTEEIPTRATTETTTTLPGTTPGVGTSQGSTPAPPVPATTERTTVVSTTTAPSTANTTPVAGTTLAVGTSPGTSQGTTPAPPLPVTTAHTTVVSSTPEVPSPSSTPSVTQGQTSTVTAVSVKSTPVSKPTEEIPTRATTETTTTLPGTTPGVGTSQGSTPAPPVPATTKHTTVVSTTRAPSTAATTPVAGTTPVVGTSPGTSQGSTPAPPLPVTTAHTTVVSSTPEVPSPGSTPSVTQGQTSPVTAVSVKSTAVSKPTEEIPTRATTETTTTLPGTSPGVGTSQGSTPGPPVPATSERTTVVSTTTAPSTSTTTPVAGTTVAVGTSPGTSQGTTPAPPLPVTTAHTTVVSSTPEVPSSSSTPSVTQGQTSTVTAVSMKSTPVSKPTEEIPTRATTETTTTLPGTTPGVGTSQGSTPAPPVPATTKHTTVVSTTRAPSTAATTPVAGTTQVVGTSPSTSQGSTPAPPLPVTTKHTTVVFSTPEVPSPGSTPSVTQGQTSPVTSVSVKSTPVSKPTEEIPTRATTETTTTLPGTTPGVGTSQGSTPAPPVPATTEHTTVVSTTTAPSTANTTPVAGTTLAVGTSPGTSQGTTPAPPLPVTTAHTTVVSSTPEVPSPSSTPSVTQGQTSTVTAVSVKSTPVSKPTEEIPTRATTETTTTLPGTTPGVGTSQGSTPAPPVPATTKHTTVVSTTRAPSTAATTPVAGTTPVVGTSPGTSQGSTPAPPLPVTTKHTTVVSSTPEVPSPGSTPSVTQGQTSPVTSVSVKSTPVSKPTEEIPTRATTETTTTLPGTTPGVGTSQGSTPTPPVPATTERTTVVSTTRAPSTAGTAPVAGTTPVVGTSPGISQGSTPAPPLPIITASTTVVSSTPEVPSSASTPSVTQGQASTVTAVSVKSTPAPPVPATTERTTLVSTTAAPSPASTTRVAGTTVVVGTSPRTSQGSTAARPLPVTTASTTVVSSTPEVPSSASTPSITQGKGSTVIVTSIPTIQTSKPTEILQSIVSTSSIRSTEGMTVVTLPKTTPCFCHVSGATVSLYSPGDVIYNRTDSAGCSFYAICNKTCEIERFQGPCPSTTPSQPPTVPVMTTAAPPASKPTIFVPSTELHTTTAVTAAKTEWGCSDISPPRKTNETWMLNNCTTAICEGDNRVVMILHPPPEKIKCANGLPAVKIEDKDGCAHYECECVCTGWSNSNYVTFDGTYYAFHDNCTYVLVKEIVDIHGSFSVLVDNYFCAAPNDQECPRSIVVQYKSAEVVLHSEMQDGRRINTVTFNNEPVHGDFSKDGIFVTTSGSMMTVEIPAINAYVGFNGAVYAVKLPYSEFQHNTEGQCGTCTNDQSDDCRLPSGHEAASCSEMAAQWMVYDESRPHCQEVPTPRPPVSTPQPPVSPTPQRPVTPTPTPCSTPAPLCELIVSDIFVDCHKVLPPKVFYEDCLLEACHSSNDSLNCHHVEVYASLCSAKGLCTDWRNKTQGKCPYHCPKHKVYKPCGPLHPATCDDGPTTVVSKDVAEGCFCSDDKILFNSYSDTCVSECGCVGPDGMPKPPGSSWKSNCQECACDPLTVSVQCKPQTCNASKTPICEKEGFVPVSVLTPEDPCCPEMQCQCNISACTNEKKSCEPGYHLAMIHFEGDCCSSFVCEPIPDTCVINKTVYTPGMTVPSKPCEICICSNVTDSNKRNLVQCTPVTCDTTCPAGYEYKRSAGECCGKCVQVACIVNINGTAEVIKPGDIWLRKGNNCSQYECEEVDNTYILVNTVRKCPYLDPEECHPDEVEMTADGCCPTCPPKKDCKVRKNETLIRQNECVSTEVVEMTYCEGGCPSSAVYSIEAKAMQHKCTCCQELKSHRREVTLTCADGRSINYDYIYVDECHCMAPCTPQATVS